MRLELGSFPVLKAAWGDRTRYADGILTIHRDSVREIVLRDARIREVDLEIVHPGDSTRILRALDAVEPLSKIHGDSSAFPGFVGPPLTCGSGRTHRLDGFTVIQVSEFPYPASGVHAFQEGIIEMSGAGAEYSACSDRVNLTLLLTPGVTSSNSDYDDAVRRAALRVADYLAGATRDLTPPAMQVFETDTVAPGAPRIVWLHLVRGQGPMIQSFLYGHEITGMLPTLLHPNELLDGALIGANYKVGTRTPTFRHTWHPSLISLYGRHGTELNFAGVIVARGHHETEFLKERSAQFVAKLARMLRADGALCSYEATGNTHVDFMMIIRALERSGIPTSAVVHEYGGPEGVDIPLVDFVPEAVALASSGGIDRTVTLPRVEKVIGGAFLADTGAPAQEEVNVPIQALYAVTSEMNVRGFVAKDY